MLDLAPVSADSLSLDPDTGAAQARTAEGKRSYLLGGDRELSVPCVGLQNSYHCAQRIESIALVQLVGKANTSATRTQGNLVIQLSSGQSVHFVDRTHIIDQTVLYSYLGYWAEIHHHLVHVQYYEGDAFLMIESSQGDRTLLEGAPVLSPDRHYLATSSYDGDETQIDLWQVSQSGPGNGRNAHSLKRLWVYHQSGTPHNLRWVGDRLAVQVQPARSAQAPILELTIGQRAETWGLLQRRLADRP